MKKKITKAFYLVIFVSFTSIIFLLSSIFVWGAEVRPYVPQIGVDNDSMGGKQGSYLYGKVFAHQLDLLKAGKGVIYSSSELESIQCPAGLTETQQKDWRRAIFDAGQAYLKDCSDKGKPSQGIPYQEAAGNPDTEIPNFQDVFPEASPEGAAGTEAASPGGAAGTEAASPGGAAAASPGGYVPQIGVDDDPNGGGQSAIYAEVFKHQSDLLKAGKGVIYSLSELESIQCPAGLTETQQKDWRRAIFDAGQAYLHDNGNEGIPYQEAADNPNAEMPNFEDVFSGTSPQGSPSSTDGAIDGSEAQRLHASSLEASHELDAVPAASVGETEGGGGGGEGSFMAAGGVLVVPGVGSVWYLVLAGAVIGTAASKGEALRKAKEAMKKFNGAAGAITDGSEAAARKRRLAELERDTDNFATTGDSRKDKLNAWQLRIDKANAELDALMALWERDGELTEEEGDWISARQRQINNEQKALDAAEDGDGDFDIPEEEEAPPLPQGHENDFDTPAPSGSSPEEEEICSKCKKVKLTTEEEKVRGTCDACASGKPAPSGSSPEEGKICRECKKAPLTTEEEKVRGTCDACASDKPLPSAAPKDEDGNLDPTGGPYNGAVPASGQPNPTCRKCGAVLEEGETGGLCAEHAQKPPEE